MQDKPGIPAWLVCVDLFTKLKTELITQAMDTLDEAVKAKAIDIKGSLINVPDKPGDTEMRIFIIHRLLEQKEKIMEMYNGFLSGTGDPSASQIEQKERVEKFLLYVEKISMLMDYGNIMEEWMHDIALEVRESEPLQVIINTMEKNESRRTVLGYILKNRTIIEEKILDKREIEMLRLANRRAFGE